MGEWPPVHQAAWDNDVGRLKRLVSSGANVNAPLNDGLTPLHIAAHQGPELPPEPTRAPAHYPAGHVEAIEFLLESGARISPRLPTGATPLYITALSGRKEALEAFIKHYPTSKNLPTDLLYAAASGSTPASP